MEVFNPVTVVTSQIGELTGMLAGVAGPALGIGAAILAITVGWKLVKRFTS